MSVSLIKLHMIPINNNLFIKNSSKHSGIKVLNEYCNQLTLFPNYHIYYLFVLHKGFQFVETLFAILQVYIRNKNISVLTNRTDKPDQQILDKKITPFNNI